VGVTAFLRIVGGWRFCPVTILFSSARLATGTDCSDPFHNGDIAPVLPAVVEETFNGSPVSDFCTRAVNVR
jgi:hypothetical protein